MQHKPIKMIWQEALDNFPHPGLESDGYISGNLDQSQSDAGVFYEEGFTFDAGNVLGDELLGQGGLEVSWDETGKLGIWGIFTVEEDCDTNGTRICVTYNATYHYDIDNQVWHIYESK